MNEMLQVNALSCRRGRRVVFREVNLTLGAGDVLLVTGANGSGKSSLLRVLAGLLPAVEGSIHWQGEAIDYDPCVYRQQVHYIGHHDAIKPELTAGEMLEYWRAIAGPAGGALREDPFGILAMHDKPTRYLSAGQKRRLALSRLVLGEAPLWLLDEPTTALDHEGQELLFACIARHRAAGGISIIATHQDMQFPEAKRYTMSGGVA